MKKNKALAVPFVLWAVLFIAVPLAMVVWYGVTVEETPAYVEVAGDNGQTLFQLEDGTVTAERPQKRTAVSLANFRRMLEPTYLKLLLRSLKIALFTTIICLLLGYPVALILSSRDFKRPGLWLMLIILPMWMNFLLRTYSWMTILENNGLLNQLFQKIGLIALYNRVTGADVEFFQMINTQGAVVLGMVYNYLPFMILPIYSVIIKLDRSLLFHICTDKNAALFYQSIVSAFCRLGYRIVAEGVETQEEMELLRSWNVDMIQGYYFSRPLPPDDLLRLLTGSAEMQAENQA